MKSILKYQKFFLLGSLSLFSSCVALLFIPKTPEETKIYEEFHAMGYPYIESPMRPAWIQQSYSLEERPSINAPIISLAMFHKDGTPISNEILKYHLSLTIAETCPYGYEEIYHIINEQKIKCHSNVFTKEIHIDKDAYCLTPTQEIKIKCLERGT